MKVKRWFFFLCAALLLTASGCQKKDRIVAQVYYHKLYLSEVCENIPEGLSPDDSVSLFNAYVDSWIKEQLVLHEAEKKLSLREKSFGRQLEECRKSLLIDAYFQKLASENTVDDVSAEEMRAFNRMFDNRYSVDREIVKVNYVKLSRNSKLIAPVKDILFNENRRKSEKQALAKMLGDSVEYMIDDSTWLYLEDVQAELPFEVAKNVDQQYQYVEKEEKGFHYLMVVLDHKEQRSVNETEEEREAARMMIAGQKKRARIDGYVDSLYRKAIQDRIVIR